MNKNSLFVRFVYSKKNEDSSNQFDGKPYKMQKKVTYIEKSNKNLDLHKTHSLNE